MSISRRVENLEDRTPKSSLTWDGNPETAEAYVKAMTTIGPVKGPAEELPEFKGSDPEAYVRQKLNE